SEAPAGPTNDDPPPLKLRFKRAEGPAALVGNAAATVDLAAGDLDGDKDQDLVVLSDHAPPELIVNDRLLRFHRVPLPATLVPRALWNGALILDAGHTGRSDLLLIAADEAPCMLLHQADA